MQQKLLIIGRSGQLAQEILQLCPEAIAWGRQELGDINSALIERIAEFAPSGIINAAAYTAVDQAEQEPEAAYLLNATLPALMAEAAKLLDIPLVQVSTDYVFDGTAHQPISVDASRQPCGVYGASKAEGEKLSLQGAPMNTCVIRTAWVYSSTGNNFVKTMLRLMQEKPALSVVADQIGTPTWAKGLAEACLYAANHGIVGIHHWTDLGVASWYDFAVAIQEIGIEKGLLDSAIPITPIPSSAYPTPAKRPFYSVLDKSTLFTDFENIEKIHWRKQLSAMMEQLQ